MDPGSNTQLCNIYTKKAVTMGIRKGVAVVGTDGGRYWCWFLGHSLKSGRNSEIVYLGKGSFVKSFDKALLPSLT